MAPPGAAAALAALFIAASAASAAIANGVNGTRLKFDSCFGCICEAASRCNRALGCNNGACGPFQITKPYWEDAGRPTLAGDFSDSEGAFERCTTDAFCSLEAVHKYTERYSKDCNGNGVVDCHDKALLHHLGLSCEGQPNPDYLQEFDDCRFNAALLEGS